MEQRDEPIIHQFSRKHASKWGIPEAILLTYFAERVRTSKNVRDNKRWFYNTAAEIATRYPYWSESTVDGIIKRLEEKKLIEIGNYNKRGYDKTRWFTVSKEIATMAAEDPVYFWIEHAQRYDIRSALVLFNLENNIQVRMEKDAKDVYHPLVPAQLAKLLPISKRQVERILKSLREDSVIHQKAENASLYSFPHLLKGQATNPGKPPTSTGIPPTDAGETPTHPGPTPTNLGNNTHYKPLETIEKPLKEPIKTPQASPAASPSSLSPETSSSTNNPNGEISLADHFFLSDYNDLKERCKQIAETHKAHLDKLISQSDQGCSHFIKSFTPALIHELSKLADRDKIMSQLLNQLSDFFDQALPSGKSPSLLRLSLFTIALDMLVTAFFRLGSHTHQDTAVRAWYQPSYNLCLKMLPIVETEEIGRERQAFEELRRKHISPDFDKEEDVDLPPATKARVLRQAVQSRNSSGWWIDYRDLITSLPNWVSEQLVWSHSTLAMAEKFFTENPEATVADVIDVLDQCVQTANRERLKKGLPEDPCKNCRKALEISNFFTRAEKVLNEIGETHQWKSLEVAIRPFQEENSLW